MLLAPGGKGICGVSEAKQAARAVSIDKQLINARRDKCVLNTCLFGEKLVNSPNENHYRNH
jgi:hypothetical protein